MDFSNTNREKMSLKKSSVGITQILFVVYPNIGYSFLLKVAFI